MRTITTCLLIAFTCLALSVSVSGVAKAEEKAKKKPDPAKMFEKKDEEYVMHHKHEKISGVKSEPWLINSQEVYKLILGKDDADKLIKKSDQGRPVELLKTRREMSRPHIFKRGKRIRTIVCGITATRPKSASTIKHG